jgi:hypothetical protein
VTTEQLAAAIAAAIVAHSFDALSGDRARLEAVIGAVLRGAGP